MAKHLANATLNFRPEATRTCGTESGATKECGGDGRGGGVHMIARGGGGDAARGSSFSYLRLHFRRGRMSGGGGGLKHALFQLFHK